MVFYFRSLVCITPCRLARGDHVGSLRVMLMGRPWEAGLVQAPTSPSLTDAGPRFLG